MAFEQAGILTNAYRDPRFFRQIFFCATSMSVPPGEGSPTEGPSTMPDLIKRTRPDRAAKLAALRAKEVCEVSVKMKLAGFCTDADMRARMDDAAGRVTRMLYEATRLINLHAVRLLAQGQRVDCEKSNFYRRALCLVSTGGQAVGDTAMQATFDTLYLPLRPAGYAVPSREGLAQVVTWTSQQMQTNAKVMVTVNLVKRLRKLIAFTVVSHSRNPDVKRFATRLKGPELQKLCTVVVDALIRGNELDKAVLVAHATRSGCLPEESAGEVADVLIKTVRNKADGSGLYDRFPDLFPIQKLKSRWTEYLPLLYHISSVFEEHLSERAQQDLPCMRGLRQFSLLPLTGLARHHVRFDNQALRELLHQREREHARAQLEADAAKESRPAPTAQQLSKAAIQAVRKFESRYFPAGGNADDQNAAMWRREGFRARKACNCAKTRAFTRVIDTDGTSVTLHVRRPGKPESGEEGDVTPHTSDEEESWMQRETSKLDRQVKAFRVPEGVTNRLYVDPGTDTMAYGILQGDGKAAPRVVKASTAEYRHLAGFGKAQRTRELQDAKHLEGMQTVHEFVTGTPSAKTTSLGQLQAHLRYVLPHLGQLLSHYGTARRRNMAFRCFSRKEAAMKAMVRKLIPSDEEWLLVYGAAGFDHAKRGRVASPYRQLKARLFALPNVTSCEVGECNTSKTCCACHKEMKHLKYWDSQQEGELVKRDIYEVKFCPECRTPWNRNVNAARNIKFLFDTLQSGKPRPEAFRPRQTTRGKAIAQTSAAPEGYTDRFKRAGIAGCEARSSAN